MRGVNLAGKVQTVLGPIEPEDLGVTMTHEHLLSVVRRVVGSAGGGEPKREIRSSIQHRDTGMDSSRAGGKQGQFQAG